MNFLEVLTWKTYEFYLLVSMMGTDDLSLLTQLFYILYSNFLWCSWLCMNIWITYTSLMIHNSSTHNKKTQLVLRIYPFRLWVMNHQNIFVMLQHSSDNMHGNKDKYLIDQSISIWIFSTLPILAIMAFRKRKTSSGIKSKVVYSILEKPFPFIIIFRSAN
jgi:hypothetical protein